MKINLMILCIFCIIVSLAFYQQTTIKKLSKNNTYEELNTYDEIISEYTEAIAKHENSNNFLLMPSDIKGNIKVLRTHKQNYIQFLKKLKTVYKKKSENELSDLYINTLVSLSNIKITSTMQLLSRMDYEMHIMKKLKKDFNERKLDKNKEILISRIDDLLVIDKFTLYKIIKYENIFYANNMKKYLDKTIDSSGYKENLIYKKFLKILHEGESLILKSIKYDSFEKFKKFINKLEVSNEEIESLVKIKIKIKNKNPSMFVKVFSDYWIRGQIYQRYFGTYGIYFGILNKIEKEKRFFQDL